MRGGARQVLLRHQHAVAGLLIGILLAFISVSGHAQFPVLTVTGGTSTSRAATPPSPPKTDPTIGLLPSDRDAWANWKMAGLLSLGGIPTRSGVCNPGGLNPIGGGSDDTANIQNAINNCSTPCATYVSSAACVIQLNAGTFTLSSNTPVIVNKGVVVRGQGAGVTILSRTNGAVPGTNTSTTYPIFQMGAGAGWGPSQALASDGTIGSTSITLASAPSGIAAGSVINLSELALGQAMSDCCVGTGQGATVQVWADPTYRFERNAHNPVAPGGLDSDCFSNNFAACDSQHTDMSAYSIVDGGVQAEYKMVTGVGTQCLGGSANTVCFDDPLTLTYRAANSAAIEVFTSEARFAGVENLTMQLGGNGNMTFQGCTYCWAKGVESYHWYGEGFLFAQGAFRDDIENYWSHNAAWPVNGGGGYSIGMRYGSSEDYIANGVSMLANKVIVVQASGAGSVVAYNYMDDGYISGNSGWVETGLNCSHLVGSHHVLFEGNRAFNVDSDFTHGSSDNCTYFRNDITGIRAAFTGEFDGISRDDTTGCCGPLRSLASHPYTYWTSFIGNIAGLSGITTPTNGWVYSNNGSAGGNAGPPSMLKLGWDDFNTNPTSTKDDVANTIYPAAASGTGPTYNTASVCNSFLTAPNSNGVNDPCQTIVDGNYDYVTGTTTWASNDTAHTLPASFYTFTAPPFFSGQTWPPIDPITPTIYPIPAYARWLACAPSSTSPTTADAQCMLSGTPVIAGVTVAGVTNPTFTSGSVTSAGAIAVAEAGGTFTGMLALGGTDAASFSLSATTLPANLNIAAGAQTCASPTTYHITITPTQAGVTNSGTAYPLTVTCVPAGYPVTAFDPTHTNANIALSQTTIPNDTAVNGTSAGADVTTFGTTTKASTSEKLFFEMKCAISGGGHGPGTGIANASGRSDGYLGATNNSASFYVTTGQGTQLYYNGSNHGAWGGCVNGDTVGVEVDTSQNPIQISVRTNHGGTWGATSGPYALPSALSAGVPLYIGLDLFSTGDGGTVCSNTACAVGGAGELPSGAVWWDAG